VSDYTPPALLGVRFSGESYTPPAGGAVDATLDIPQGYEAPVGSALFFLFDGSSYSPPMGNDLLFISIIDGSYTPPAPNNPLQANFMILLMI
jgi:hypothetical protein